MAHVGMQGLNFMMHTLQVYPILVFSFQFLFNDLLFDFNTRYISTLPIDHPVQ